MKNTETPQTANPGLWLVIAASSGALFITDSRRILATDSRFELQAKNEAGGFEIVCYKKGLTEELPDIAADLNIKRLGFESIRLFVFWGYIWGY